MKSTSRIFLLAASAAVFSAPVAAQPDSKPLKIPSPVKIDPRLDPKFDPRGGPVETTTVLGCLQSMTYNTQNIDDYSMQFRIMTDSGPHAFNFASPNIQKFTSSFPLANREQTLKWERIMEALEAAGVANINISVSYEVPTNNVFGISLLWDQPCYRGE